MPADARCEHSYCRGASAICCGVAAALVAESLDEVIDATVFGARHGGERLGIEWAGTLVSARIELALRIVRESRDAVEAEDQLYTTCGVGMDPTELVPTAIGLFALHEGDPQRTVPAAANMGGDTDTLASMAGGLVRRLPRHWGVPGRMGAYCRRSQQPEF